MHGAQQPINPYLLASNNQGEYNVQRRYLQQAGWGSLVVLPAVGIAISMLLYGLMHAHMHAGTPPRGGFH